MVWGCWSVRCVFAFPAVFTAFTLLLLLLVVITITIIVIIVIIVVYCEYELILNNKIR